MITLISAKLGTEGPPQGGQGAYARDLLQYMDSPENSQTIERVEKCVATASGNLPREGMDAEEIAACMIASLSKSKHLANGQGIDHWVHSFNPTAGENPPAPDEIFKGVRQWLKLMGYEDHAWHAAIHDDTEHRHVHIAICRMNERTGKVKPRGFWKRENQKAMFEVALAQGWEVESGTKRKFKIVKKQEAILTPDPITGLPEIEVKPMVEEKPEIESLADKHPGRKAARAEIASGLKSEKRILRERLLKVYGEIKDDLSSMKWGQIHNALARAGLQMERTEHADKNGVVKFGLVFSADGESWASASALGIKELSWNALNERVGKTWRKANTQAEEILRESREKKPKPEPDEHPEIKKQRIYILKTMAQQKRQIAKYEKMIADMQTREKLAAMRMSVKHVTLKIIDFPFHDDTLKKQLIEAIDRFINDILNIGKNIELMKKRHKLIEKITIAQHQLDDIFSNLKSIHEQKNFYIGMVEPMIKQEEKIMKELTKSQEAGLRGISINAARAKAKEKGIPITEAEKTKHGLDVFIQECGLGFEQGIIMAATLFPEALEAGEKTGVTTYADAIARAQKLAQERGWPVREYKKSDYGYEIGQEIVKWFKALQLAEIDVNVRVTEAAKEANAERSRIDKDGKKKKGLYSEHLTSLDLVETLARLPNFMAMEAAGSADAPIHTFVTPKWPEGRIGIMIDDVLERQALDKLGTPSAIVDTSQHKAQFFYIVETKGRPKEFFDDMMKLLNAEMGDPKVTKTGHNTRLAGFRNMKHGQGENKGPKVAVRSYMTNEPTRFTDWLEEQWQQWEIENKERVKKRIQIRERPAIPEKDYKPIEIDRTDFKDFEASIKIGHVPDWIREAGKNLQMAIMADAQKAVDAGEQAFIDRSRVDFMTARGLYAAGATPHEVASFLAEHSAQDDSPVIRPYGTVRGGGMHTAIRRSNWKEIERAARLTAANACPHHPQSWRNLHPEEDEKAMLTMTAKYGAMILEAQVMAQKARQMDELQKQQASQKQQISQKQDD